MMKLMRISLKDATNGISFGGELFDHLQGLEKVRMLFAPGLNSTGLQRGSRYYNIPFDHHTGTGSPLIDLNRQWKPGAQHSVTQPVWKAIEELPGRVYVVDVHSQAASETFAYISEKSRVLLQQAIPDLFVKSVPLDSEEYSSTLQGAAEAAGHWAITLEMSSKEPDPECFGAVFIRSLIKKIMR